MKFYKAGKKLKNIDELEIGKQYSVCGIVGELSTVPTPTSELVYKFVSKSEKICLLIGREEITDRIHFGFVYETTKEFKPRAKTLAKML